MKRQQRRRRRSFGRLWLAGLAGAIAVAVAAACSVNVPLGVDPNSDAAAVDARDGGGGS
jgi:hypothetical protein